MIPEQKAAYINAKVVSAQAEIAGMLAENKQREIEGKSLAYTFSDFSALIDKYQLGENDLVEYCFRE